jgi:hypothetical protein
LDDPERLPVLALGEASRTEAPRLTLALPVPADTLTVTAWGSSVFDLPHDARMSRAEDCTILPVTDGQITLPAEEAAYLLEISAVWADKKDGAPYGSTLYALRVEAPAAPILCY